MDYLKYVPILNLVLIVILFVLWFRAHSEQFEAGDGSSFVVVNTENGDITTVPIDIKKMLTELLKQYPTTKDIQKKLSLYAKDKDAKQIIEITSNFKKLFGFK